MSLPSRSARKGKMTRREYRRDEVSGGYRDGSRKRYIGERTKRRRKTREAKRGRTGVTARQVYPSFIFSPRLNIKDNLIIGGFSKADRASFLLSLSLSLLLR